MAGLTGARERAGQVEHEVPGVPGRSCSQAPVAIAHTEPKAISDFVQTIISVLLFGEETEECLGAAAMSLGGWKTKTCIEAVYSTSHLMTNPGHAKRATNGKTAPRGRHSGKNFMVIQG